MFYEFIIGETSEQYPLGTFQKMCEQYFGIYFKLSQTGLFRRRPGSRISPFITVVKPVFSENGVLVKHDIVQQGPVFLKRSFVNIKIDGVYHVMPWRHENDYYHRFAVSAKNTGYDVFKWRSKFLGLLIDTMGTNAVAYKACKGMYYGLINLPASWKTKRDLHVPVHRTIDPRVFVDVPTNEQLQEYVSQGDERLTKSFEKTGLPACSAINSINQSWLMKQFVWDETWRLAWAVHYKVDMYDPYGNKIAVEWGGRDNSPQEYMEHIEAEYGEWFQ